MLPLFIVVLLTTAVVLQICIVRRASSQHSNYARRNKWQDSRSLLAVIARDLQYPINSVALSSSVLAKALENQEADIRFVIQNLKAIHRCAVRTNHVIEDLITYTEIEAGDLCVRPQSCDIRILLRDFEEAVLPLFGEDSIEFVASVAKDVPNAFVDPDRLMQILSNIVGDAFNRGRPHPVVVVSVQPADGCIQFRISASGACIVGDEISGDSDDVLESGADQSRLALHVCRGLVEAHGGRFWLDTTAGKATASFFTLPHTGTLDQATAQTRIL